MSVLQLTAAAAHITVALSSREKICCITTLAAMAGAESVQRSSQPAWQVETRNKDSALNRHWVKRFSHQCVTFLSPNFTSRSYQWPACMSVESTQAVENSCRDHRSRGVTRNSGEGLDKISRRTPLLSLPYSSPPIPFKHTHIRYIHFLRFSNGPWIKRKLVYLL